MKKSIKIFGHLLSVSGLLLLAILPANKYSWMKEMDPSINGEDPSGNRLIFSLTILIIIGIIEMMISLKTAKVEKIVSLSIIVAGVLIWWIKYLVV
jgi:uncharacterized membrane protein